MSKYTWVYIVPSRYLPWGGLDVTEVEEVIDEASAVRKEASIPDTNHFIFLHRSFIGRGADMVAGRLSLLTDCFPK